LRCKVDECKPLLHGISGSKVRGAGEVFGHICLYKVGRCRFNR